jgi:hypothetical protein
VEKMNERIKQLDKQHFEDKMTNEEIHNIYLHMSGKSEGLFEATGEADFPVLFARAILEYSKNQWVGLTDELQIEVDRLTMLVEATTTECNRLYRVIELNGKSI